MRRFLDFGRRAAKRVNARMAIVAVLLVSVLVAGWFGYQHFMSRPAEGPLLEIATGGPEEASLDPTLRPSSVKPQSSQFNTGGSGLHQVASYGETPQGGEQLNPYAPSASDPAGGTGSSGYGGTSGYGGSSSYGGSSGESGDSPATVPDNPYRGGAGGGSYGSLTDSPATSPTQKPGAAIGKPSTAAVQPASDPAQAYGDTYGGSAASGQSGTEETPAETAAQEPAPLVSGPATSLGNDPYGLSGRRSPVASQPPRAAAAGELASATPGERQLEGPQQPAIAIEKFAPAEIQVGKPAVFEMLVRNTGQVPAQNVVITDHVPTGTELLEAKPQPQEAADGSLVWSLGTMQPGDEVAIAVQVMPQTEGEIGSTAHVTFAAAATSRSICTRPQLAIEHTAPPKVLIGESLTVGITVSNSGTGPATGVFIEEDVPEGLSHVAGAQLEYEVGTLRPGESKRLELSLKAEKAGLIQNTIHVHGDASLAGQHTVQIEVIAPQLAVEVDGPKRRFLERQATYTLSIANPGTAPAHNVELAAFLPRGMKFVDTDSQGQYDPTQHAVFWSLEELPPAKAGAVKLTTLPIEPGEQRMRIEGRAGLGLAAEGEQVVQVEQSAELVHAVNDVEEVIEVGSETTYEIRVTNTGTKAATNVRIAALLPAEMQALGGEGPTRAEGDAQKVIFEPLARLNPQEEVVYKVQVQGLAPGDHIVRVQLASDEWPTPVTREESTRVYEDR
jgi:uncharacterized repeat protein (TIGR01451 family)